MCNGVRANSCRLGLQSEVNFLGRLSHPNLVRLLGYCWEEKELLLVYEYMAKGSLENHLFRSEYCIISDFLFLSVNTDKNRGRSVTKLDSDFLF